MFNLLNDHTAYTVLYFGIMEVVLVAWLYGVNKFMDNIAEMSVPMPWLLRVFWTVCWAGVTPVLSLTILFLNLTDRFLGSFLLPPSTTMVTLTLSRKPDQDSGYVYPPAAQVGQ